MVRSGGFRELGYRAVGEGRSREEERKQPLAVRGRLSRSKKGAEERREPPRIGGRYPCSAVLIRDQAVVGGRLGDMLRMSGQTGWSKF